MKNRKTYTVVLGGLAVVAGMFLQGQIDIAEAVNQVVLLLGIGGLRIGIANNSK
jgi:hypothetical protein